VKKHFDSPPFLSGADPATAQPWRVSFRVVWRFLEPPLWPRASFGAMRCAGKFSNTDGTVLPALQEWVVGSILISFSHSSLGREGGDRCDRCAAAIAFKVVALVDLSSILILLSPKVSCKLNEVNRVLG
jgi:hypothetical protein